MYEAQHDLIGIAPLEGSCNAGPHWTLGPIRTLGTLWTLFVSVVSILQIPGNLKFVLFWKSAHIVRISVYLFSPHVRCQSVWMGRAKERLMSSLRG